MTDNDSEVKNEPPRIAEPEPGDGWAAADAAAEAREKRLARAKEEKSARAKIIAIAVVILVVLAVAIPFGVFAVQQRLSATQKLDSALALAKKANPTVAQVDVVIRATIETGTAARVADVQAKIPLARQQLTEAGGLVDAAWPKLNDDERKQAAALKASAAARVAMLDAADPLLKANAEAAKAIKPMREAWTYLAAAQSQSATAAALFNTLKRPHVVSADAYLVYAHSDLASAAVLFRRADRAFPPIHMQQYLSYTDQRLRLVALARASNAAWLKKNNVLANKYSSQYNSLDKQAVAAARHLPATPEREIAAAFDRETKKAAAAYTAARVRAQAADKALSQL